MDGFLKRKREPDSTGLLDDEIHVDDDEPTDVKLAILASLFPDADSDNLLESLLACDGSVKTASRQLQDARKSSPVKKRLASSSVPGYQSSLTGFTRDGESVSPKKKPLTRKGKTLHLYSPEDIAAHTPCSMIHNFLPVEQANLLLEELLKETPTYSRDTFRLFENIVQSPHTFCFYVDSEYEAESQKTEFIYNGDYVNDVRKLLPEMQKVSARVQETVNREICTRIKTHYPGQKKLKYQSPREWMPNTAFVNCYDGAKENVGYHSDQLTYLGPRAVIGSLSLGVAREFRIRRVVPRNTQFDPDDTVAKKANDERADVEGQISIHLPHNSLLIMHAEMQEEWKHSIAPAPSIEPHPIAKNKRLNITYRNYRPAFHPKFTPKCKCDVPTCLRCVQKKQENRGRYMWMCHAGYNPKNTEQPEGCGFFQWAQFDDDGEPPWSLEKRACADRDENLDEALLETSMDDSSNKQTNELRLQCNY